MPSTPQLFPPGHFYSPIVEPSEIASYLDQVFAQRTVAGIELSIDAQHAFLVRLAAEMAHWPEGKNANAMRYVADNDQFGPGDAACYFAILRHLRPARVIEVGSGWSSAISLDANETYGGKTHFTFIEPYPDRLLSAIRRNDRTKTEIIRTPVQAVSLDTFDALDPRDILFIDSTHVMKAGSDVQYLLGEVLPRLKTGVFVHIHDMFFPFEYPRAWVEQGRNWNELYAVKSFLQFNSRFRIVFWNHFLATIAPDELHKAIPPTTLNPGGGLWLQVM